MSIVFLKLGGSFVTYKSKPVTIRYDALSALRDILHGVEGRELKIVIGNGGGSFAHYTVMKHSGAEGKTLLVKCHQSTRLLNRIIVDYLIANDIPATSIQTSAIIKYDDESMSFKVFYEPVLSLLAIGVIPVVYGECLPSIDKPIVVSTEKVFELLSKKIKPERIVLLTDVNGVYTCDPKKCENPVLIREIKPSSLSRVLELLRDHEKSDVTGGMYNKVLLMSKLSMELKTDIFIVSGHDVRSAVEAITGGVPDQGTLITYRDG